MVHLGWEDIVFCTMETWHAFIHDIRHSRRTTPQANKGGKTILTTNFHAFHGYPAEQQRDCNIWDCSILVRRYLVFHRYIYWQGKKSRISIVCQLRSLHLNGIFSQPISLFPPVYHK